MASNQDTQEKKTKWEVIYEDEGMSYIWKYNSKITTYGPVEVEIRYKRGYKPEVQKKKKSLGDLVAEQKKKNKSDRSKF